MDVSIVVPVYNAENSLKKCLNSLIDQKFNSYEIIIIDDGSTDNSKSILLEYKENNKNIVFVSQHNAGVSVARNVGISLARGKYICFVDADDFLELDAIQKMYDVINNNMADVVVCRYFYHSKSNVTKHQFIDVKKYYHRGGEAVILAANCLWPVDCADLSSPINIGVPWAKMYRLRFLKENNILFKENLRRREDSVFNIEVFCSTSKVIFFSDYLYHYFSFDESSSNAYNPEIGECNLLIFENIDKLTNRNNSKILNDAAKLLYLSAFLDYIRLFLNKSEFNIKERVEILKKEYEKTYKHKIENISNDYLTLKQSIFIKLLKFKMYYLIVLIFMLTR